MRSSVVATLLLIAIDFGLNLAIGSSRGTALASTLGAGVCLFLALEWQRWRSARKADDR